MECDLPTSIRNICPPAASPLPRGVLPLNANKYTIGMASVVMLVVLRLSLGCHFLYEGVWKIKNKDSFSAKPFLSEAKGPMSPVFYAMLDDISGSERLDVEKKTDANGHRTYEMALEQDADGHDVPKLAYYAKTWETLKDRVTKGYKFDDEQTAQADQLYKTYLASAREYIDDRKEDVLAYFGSRGRFEAAKAEGNNGAKHIREGAWKRERALRKEVDAWIGDLDKMGRNFQTGLWNLMTEEQQNKGPITAGWNPFHWTREAQISFAVTWALTLIGLCLMLGLFTPLAALGGAAFMFAVVLTQPAWPSIVPADPPVVGHALLINKDFIEMIALLVVAATMAGRWAGLDYFINHLVLKPFLAKRMTSNK